MILSGSRSLPRRVLALCASALLITAVAPRIATADLALPAPTVTPGTVTAFGGPVDMQSVLQPPEGLDDAVAVAASDAPDSYSSLALRADGTVVGWGLNSYGEASVPTGLDDAVAVDVGAGFSVALGSDGSITTWGADDAGQLDVPSDLGPATAVAAGGYLGYRGYGVPYAACGYALALRLDGTVARWGENRDGSGCEQLDARLDPPSELTGVVAISAGDRMALALKSDGKVVAWGPGVSFRLDGTPPASWSDVVAISAGMGNMLGLRSDGTVLAYGIWGESGPPSIDGVQALSAGQVDLFLHNDSTISAYRPMSGVPTDSGYEAVSAGSDFGLAIHPADNPEQFQPALGTAEVQPSVDTNPAGRAEAFKYMAVSDARVSSFHVYLDDGNTADTVLVGVYSNHRGQPGTLLSRGMISSAAAGAWNVATIRPVSLQAGRAYWLALLGPTGGGAIAFRDQPDGSGGPTRLSAQTHLSVKSGLPCEWRSGAKFANSRPPPTSTEQRSHQLNRRLVYVSQARVLLVGLARESSAAIWLALPGFVEPAGSTAVD